MLPGMRSIAYILTGNENCLTEQNRYENWLNETPEETKKRLQQQEKRGKEKRLW